MYKTYHWAINQIKFSRPVGKQRFGKYWKGYVGAIVLEREKSKTNTRKQQIYTHRKIIEPLDGKDGPKKVQASFDELFIVKRNLKESSWYDGRIQLLSFWEQIFFSMLIFFFFWLN